MAIRSDTGQANSRLKTFIPLLNKLVEDIVRMPAFLKLLFVIALYTTITSFIDLFHNAPIDFEYFGTTFPRSYPIIWHLVSCLTSTLAVVTYMLRSYRLLKIYLNINMSFLFLAALNAIYIIYSFPISQRISATFTYGGTIAIGIALYFYQMSQRKYFNKP